MTDSNWKIFLTIARNILGKGENVAWASESWCAFTTFSMLSHDLTYWAIGLPEIHDLLDSRTKDGCLWGQSFDYSDLAHMILPAHFYWEKSDKEKGFLYGYKQQKIQALSAELNANGIEHRITDLVLEVKLY